MTNRSRTVGALARTDAVIASLVGILSFVVRLPTRSQFLVNWDAVNFALGINAFDLGAHQPHPPGYIGYVLVGRAFAAVTGDVNAGLTLLSLVAGAALPAIFYLLARRFLRRGHAVAVTLFVATSPLVWYYSVVALTYIVGAAVALALVWAAYVARTEDSPRHLVAGSVLLVVIGALRQTDLLLLLPVWLYAARGFDWRWRRRAGAVLVLGTAAWLIPLTWLAGGPGRYLELSASLAEFVGGRTWLLSMNLLGFVQNIGLVGAGLLLGLNLLVLTVVPLVRYRRRVWHALGPDGRGLMLAWVVPALVVYLFVHTGQMGYVLLVLPAGFIVAGLTLREMLEARRSSAPSRSRGLLLAPGSAVTLVIAINVAVFLFLPEAGLALFDRDRGGGVMEYADEREHAEQTTRQYDVPANDRYWGGVTRVLRHYDTTASIVLALPTNRGSFRHLAYYAPAYQIYGIGTDLENRFGYLFRARDRESDYSVSGFDEADGAIPLPRGTTHVLIPDPTLIEALGDGVPVRLHKTHEGATVVVVPVEDGAWLRFWRDGAGDARLSVASGPPPPRPGNGGVAPVVR